MEFIGSRQNKGRIDMTQAGSNEIAFNTKGAWMWSIYDLFILLKGNSNQIGLNLETTTTGGYNWGNYCGNIKNITIFGGGGYGIKGLTNDPAGTGPGGLAQVTNLTIDGGWIQGPSYPAYFDTLAIGKINGIVLAGGINALTLNDSFDVTLSLGETGPCTNYNFMIERYDRIFDFGSARVNPGALGYTNDSKSLLGIADRSLTLSADSDNLYSSSMHSNYNYANPFELSCQGGTGQVAKLLQYSEIQGTSIGSFANSNVINIRAYSDVTFIL